MRRTIRIEAALIAATLSLTLVPPSAECAADATLRSIRGSVVATDPAAAPPTIVISARTPKNEELIVGATLDAQTQVLRGTAAIGLGELKQGETVTLRYVKTDDGLVARLIRAD